MKNLIEGANPDRQMAVVSATITEEIEIVARKLMNDPVRIQVFAEDMPRSGKVVHSFVKTEVRDKTDLLRVCHI